MKPFTAPKLGDKFAKAFRVAETRVSHDAWQKALAEVARQIGANLADPDDFRTVEELMRGH